jgi:hypothetical protein
MMLFGTVLLTKASADGAPLVQKLVHSGSTSVGFT